MVKEDIDVDKNWTAVLTTSIHRKTPVIMQTTRMCTDKQYPMHLHFCISTTFCSTTTLRAVMWGRSLTSALLLQKLEPLENKTMSKYVHSFTNTYETWEQISGETEH
jgi:hypothetical protein